MESLLDLELDYESQDREHNKAFIDRQIYQDFGNGGRSTCS